MTVAPIWCAARSARRNSARDASRTLPKGEPMGMNQAVCATTPKPWRSRAARTAFGSICPGSAAGGSRVKSTKSKPFLPIHSISSSGLWAGWFMAPICMASLSVTSIRCGYSSGDASTMSRGRTAMSSSIFTIGHSNHPLDRFLALLAQHEVEALVDIRRFPGSRKHPHFIRDNLAAALPKSGVEYHWLEALGGRRHKQGDDSPNRGLGNEGFRNYADYMLTDEFRAGVEKLLEVARQKRTAIMCAEGLFWQCHRRLVSDFLVANGVAVQHIMPSGELRPHKLTSGAVIAERQVTYPGER